MPPAGGASVRAGVPGLGPQEAPPRSLSPCRPHAAPARPSALLALQSPGLLLPGAQARPEEGAAGGGSPCGWGLGTLLL